MRVLNGVVHLAKRGVALIVERAVGQFEGPEEVPHLMVAPVEQGEYPIELWPSGAALADGFQVPGPRVGPSVAHDDAFDPLALNQLLDLGLEVC